MITKEAIFALVEEGIRKEGEVLHGEPGRSAFVMMEREPTEEEAIRRKISNRRVLTGAGAGLGAIAPLIFASKNLVRKGIGGAIIGSGLGYLLGRSLPVGKSMDMATLTDEEAAEIIARAKPEQKMSY